MCLFAVKLCSLNTVLALLNKMQGSTSPCLQFLAALLWVLERLWDALSSPHWGSRPTDCHCTILYMLLLEVDVGM